MTNNVIKELNTFLEGNFMAVHAYEKYIQHIDDGEIKRVLQIIQQNHKNTQWWLQKEFKILVHPS